MLQMEFKYHNNHKSVYKAVTSSMTYLLFLVSSSHSCWLKWSFYLSFSCSLNTATAGRAEPSLSHRDHFEDQAVLQNAYCGDKVRKSKHPLDCQVLVWSISKIWNYKFDLKPKETVSYLKKRSLFLTICTNGKRSKRRRAGVGIWLSWVEYKAHVQQKHSSLTLWCTSFLLIQNVNFTNIITFL